MACPPPSVSREEGDEFVTSAESSDSSPFRVPVGSGGSHQESGTDSRGGAPQWALLATLIRPQGRKGELLADLLTDFPDRFHERKRLFLLPPAQLGTRAREVQLEDFWLLRNRLVLKFEGVDSINDAEALRGFDVAIPLAERAPLEPGSAYISDLVGCTVFDLNRDGAEVGEIVEVDRESSNADLLVLRRRGMRGAAGEVLIPFVRDYLVAMDVAGKRVEMRLPEGLLEINAPLSEEEKRENCS